MAFRCVRSDAQRWLKMPKRRAHSSIACVASSRSSRASMLGIEVLEVKFMGQERFYGASTGYPSVKDIVAGARAGQLRGRPAKRRLAALRLVAHHRRLEDAQNGDHTQLIRAHTPDAQRRQPRTGSTPHLGRGQQ